VVGAFRVRLVTIGSVSSGSLVFALCFLGTLAADHLVCPLQSPSGADVAQW